MASKFFGRRPTAFAALNDDVEDNAERIGLLGPDRNDLKIDPRSENFTGQIHQLQKILQFGSVPLQVNADSSQRYFSAAQVRGYLSIHGDPSKSLEHSPPSNRYYCELVDTYLFYRRGESDVKYKGGISISYCHVEAATKDFNKELNDSGIQQLTGTSGTASGASSVHSADATGGSGGHAVTAAAKSALLNFDSSAASSDFPTDMTTVEQDKFIHSTESLGAPCAPGSEGDDNYEDLYMAFLERQEGSHCFKVYTADSIFIFQAESSEDRKRWVEAIQNALKKEFTPAMWQAKQESARELQPLYREQFVFSLDKHKFVLNSLHSTGLLADVSVLRSKNKEKSGVLSIETKDSFGGSVWTDYFLVLLEGVLYYFAHSSASIPKGFVALKYAHVSLVGPMLSDDEFVFRITTPLRTLCLRAKHAVALAEWIAVLERAIANCCRQVKTAVVSNVSGQDLSSILTRINQHRAKLGSFSALIESPKACRIFEEFLEMSQEASLLKFWMDLDKFKKDCTGFRNEQHRYKKESASDAPSVHKRKASKVYHQTVGVLDAYSEAASPPRSRRNSSKASQRSATPEHRKRRDDRALFARCWTEPSRGVGGRLPQGNVSGTASAWQQLAPSLKNSNYFHFEDIAGLDAATPNSARSAPSSPQNSKESGKGDGIHRPVPKRANGSSHNGSNGHRSSIDEFNAVFPSDLHAGTGLHDEEPSFAGTPPNELADEDDTRGDSEFGPAFSRPTGEARNDIVLVKMFERLVELAHSIFQKFLDESSQTTLQNVNTIKLKEKSIETIRRNLDMPAMELFHDVRILVGPVLRKRYDSFLQDDSSKKLVEGVNRRTQSEREVAPFGPDKTYRFVALCTNGTPHKRFVKAYKFPYDRRMMSLGRDISNDIVLNDNRVSRSHARVTYSATECVYYDLGSSHGSKLNRRRFVHGKLAHGDLLQLGDTVLCFEVREKKKKTFFNKLRKK